MLQLRAWVGVAALLAALVSGCGGGSAAQHDAAAQQDANVQQDSGPVCSVDPGTSQPACNGCLAEKCCDQATACQADADCKVWMDCVSPCALTDDACVIGCWTDHPAGDVRTAYGACLVQECPTECEAPACGGWYWTSATCGDCNKANCCAENTACGDDLECQLFNQCLIDCQDTACSTACYKDHLAGGYVRAPAMACMFTSCPTECGITAASCGGWNFPAPACGTCVQTNCCDEYTALTNDAESWKYLYCAWGCGQDQACLTDCWHTNWKGAGPNNVASFCQAQHCATECNYADPPACGYLNGSIAACNTCMDAHCCEGNTACTSNADCMAYTACITGCAQGDEACAGACWDGTSDRGLGYFYSFQLGCLGVSCETECQFAEPVTCGGLGFRDATCNTCLKGQCCTEATAVTSDPEAASLEICIERCEVGDTACADMCKSGYATAAQDKAQAFRTCIDTNCGTGCWTPQQDGGT